MELIMKNLRNTLLTILLTALSSPCLVAMKRQSPVDANDLPGVPPGKKHKPVQPDDGNGLQRGPVGDNNGFPFVGLEDMEPIVVGGGPISASESDTEYESESESDGTLSDNEDGINALTQSLANFDFAINTGMELLVQNIFEGNTPVQGLQHSLDELCADSLQIPKAQATLQALVTYIRKCIGMVTLHDVQRFFNTLAGESTFKMALRLTCAQIYNQDLDNLPCVSFMTNIGNWVNGNSFEQNTVLLSQTYLRDMLRLIEPLLRIPVTVLNLCNNQLVSLPKEICLLSNLKTLWLSKNNLTNIPDEIGCLDQLEGLWISDNQLEELPGSIGNLINLEYLHVYNNDLINLPSSLMLLQNLKQLTLDGNDFSVEQKSKLPEYFKKNGLFFSV